MDINEDSRGDYDRIVPKDFAKRVDNPIKKSKEKDSKSKKDKGKGIFKGKFLSKPKINIEGANPKKVLSRFGSNQGLVREGRTGYFSDEYDKEIKWLS